MKFLTFSSSPQSQSECSTGETWPGGRMPQIFNWEVTLQVGIFSPISLDNAFLQQCLKSRTKVWQQGILTNLEQKCGNDALKLEDMCVQPH